MDWFQSLIYGLVSGFAEFLPISSQGHQKILMHLFGVQNRDPVRDFVVHIALLLSLYFSCKPMFDYLRRERAQQIRKKRRNISTSRVLLDEQFAKNATVLLLLFFMIFSFIFKHDFNLLWVACFLLINGTVLFLSGRMMQGNKDVRSMTYLDSILIGIAGSLSAFTGISRIGCITSTAIARGADRKNALNWALLISIPALILHLCIDVIAIFSGIGTVGFFANLFTYIISGIGSYIAGHYGIKFMRFLAVRVGFSGFAYYCWGTALFSFLLYLTVA